MSSPEVKIEGSNVSLWDGRHKLASSSVAEFVDALVSIEKRPPRCGLIPQGVRLWYERGPAVGVVVEIPAHCRTVRWVPDDSPSPFGAGAKYNNYFISLPYIVLLLVFLDGCLTPYNQLFYRREPLDSGQTLLLPNLRNVTRAYGLRSWVCLVNLGELGRRSWTSKIKSVVNHVLTAGFNLSGEVHEGHSYWGEMRDLDPRVGSMEAWQEATRKNPRFILEVPWKRAGTRAARELMVMLDHTIRPPRFMTSSDLIGLVTGTSRW